MGQKAIGCYYCEKKRQIKRDCFKRKAGDVKGKKKPRGGRQDGVNEGDSPPRAALAYAASERNAKSHQAGGSANGASTWVLDSGAIKNMAAGYKDFTVKMSGSGAKDTPADGQKVSIKGHGCVSMDVGNGNIMARRVLGKAMRVPDLTYNCFSVRADSPHGGALVLLDGACYIVSDGEAVVARASLINESVITSFKESENYMLKVTPATASASASSTRMYGEAEIWKGLMNRLGFQNIM